MDPLSPNVALWIVAGWKYELTAVTADGVTTYTARLYSGVTTAHTKSAGTASDAAIALANAVPLTVTPIPP